MGFRCQCRFVHLSLLFLLTGRRKCRISLSSIRFGYMLKGFLTLCALSRVYGLLEVSWVILDIDLFSLRKRGVVRILVDMFDTKVFLKLQDSLGYYILSDAMDKHKAYEFRFRLEPEG